MRKKGILYVIIGLAIIGAGFQLIKNPSEVLKWLFFLFISAVIIYTVVRLLVNKSKPTATNEMKKYKRAVKQSKQRYQHHQQSSKGSQQNTQRKKRRKRPTHLRVIDGHKSKNKGNKDSVTF